MAGPGRCVRRIRFQLATFTATVLLSTTLLAQEHVILLHGLCRTSRSMEPMRRALRQAGYVVANLDYPSRKGTVEELSESVIGTALEDCRVHGATKIHF